MRLKSTSLLLTLCLIFVLADKVYSQEEEWNVFSSRFCTIFYEEGVDLKRLNRRVNLRFSDFYSPRRYREKADFSMEDIVAEKFDAIFARVEDILDMYPSRIHVAINIYNSKDALDAAYEEIFNEPNTAVAFYVYKTNTIYITGRQITESILSHEMAHCIIDHYFVILPPRKIQEMLAVYVDVHLKD